MSPLFGKKGSDGATVAILDIENGSVGGALVRVASQFQPRLFAQTRNVMPTAQFLSANELELSVRENTEEVLRHLSEVAARLRNSDAVSHAGDIQRVAAFLHVPWARVVVEKDGKVTSLSDPHFLDELRSLAQTAMGNVPVSFHSFGGATAPLVHSLFNAPDWSLSCNISGEVTEVLLARGSAVVGQGTIPMGTNTLVRTLKTHGGFTEHEARSALAIDHPHAREPLGAAKLHFVREFKDVAQTLLEHTPVDNAFVIAQEPVGDWFARALAHEDLADIFKEGGVVRAVRAQHLTPHIAEHSLKPDVPLLLSALFIDARFS
jgi:hypothetical protein